MIDMLMAQFEFWAWLFCCVAVDAAAIYLLLNQWLSAMKSKLPIAIFIASIIALFGKNYADDFSNLLVAAFGVIVASSLIWLAIQLPNFVRQEFIRAGFWNKK